MKIYWIKAQAPLRVLALVKHLGIDADLVQLDLMAGGLKSADFARLNPNVKVPALVDGDVVLWEASAIMAYLCIKTGSDMWPAHSPAEQVEVLRWLSWSDCHWSPAVGPFYFEHVVKATFGIGGRTYVACGRLTIADFQLASMATFWRESHMPLEGSSNIVRWIDGLKRNPAWSDPWPDES